MKRLLILILVIFICVPFTTAYANDNDNINILCLGNYLEPDVPPFMADSRIMAPVRAVFESVGATVTWDESTATATGRKNNTEVVMSVGSNVVMVNGTPVYMDTALTMKNNRVFAPVRYVAESFGYKVSYHDQSRTAVISENKNYNFYNNISIPVPTFDSVTGSAIIKTEKDKNGYDTYYYSYHEDYATDYLNYLQADFGYILYNFSFENGAYIYEYVCSKNQTVKISDYHMSDGIITVSVVPNSQQEFSVRTDTVVSQEPSFVPGYNPPVTDNNTKDNQNDMKTILDYGSITGAQLIGVIDDDVNSESIYRYTYNQFSLMQYENYLTSLGWRFYDFDFNIDTFSNTTYYIKGDMILVVSYSQLLREVWLIYP